jgi:hypothetical protein
MRSVWSPLLPDARYALRSLRSSLGVTAVAVATLAIGSGAATAMFAVVDSVLLEPLAYPEADELVAIWHRAPGADLMPTNAAGDVLASTSMFITYAEENRVFDALGVWTPGIVGLYGAISYAVSLRRREIAIRLALGAQQRAVRRQFVRHGVALAAAGLALGVIAAAGLVRLMTSLLYGVEPVDPLTYGAVAAGLIGVAALASYVPARRASSVDPAASLAAE